MAEADELVTIYTGANVTEAHLVKNLLLEENIDAYVAEENEPFAGLPIVPPDVMVQRKNEAAARQIVAEYERQRIQRAERPDWVCPNCGVTVVGAFDACDNCGQDRPGTEEPDDEGPPAV